MEDPSSNYDGGKFSTTKIWGIDMDWFKVIPIIGRIAKEFQPVSVGTLSVETINGMNEWARLENLPQPIVLQYPLALTAGYALRDSGHHKFKKAVFLEYQGTHSVRFLEKNGYSPIAD